VGNKLERDPRDNTLVISKELQKQLDAAERAQLDAEEADELESEIKAGKILYDYITDDLMTFMVREHTWENTENWRAHALRLYDEAKGVSKFMLGDLTAGKKKGETVLDTIRRRGMGAIQEVQDQEDEDGFNLVEDSINIQLGEALKRLEYLLKPKKEATSSSMEEEEDEGDFDVDDPSMEVSEDMAALPDYNAKPTVTQQRRIGTIDLTGDAYNVVAAKSRAQEVQEQVVGSVEDRLGISEAGFSAPSISDSEFIATREALKARKKPSEVTEAERDAYLDSLAASYPVPQQKANLK
jgi:hypothetical protein